MSATRSRARNALIVAALTLFIAMVVGVYHLLFERLLHDLRDTEHNALELITSSLRGEIKRFEILGSVLATNRELLQFLRAEPTAESAVHINRKLEEINRSTGALDTYLLDTTGKTIAASNWRKPINFVGENFAYRPYYQLAINGQAGNFFAIGTTSKERGFYVATPVRHGHQPVGVVVIKIRVEHLERLWKEQNRALSLVDANGVIFISTQTNWRLKTLQPLDDQALSSIRETRQYLDAGTLKLLDYTRRDILSPTDTIVEMGSGAGERAVYLQLASAMEEANWTLLLHTRINDVQRIALLGTLAISFGIAGAVIIALAIVYRLRKAKRRLENEQRYRNTLESAIAERTRDLQHTNQELLQTQRKLLQSGRLAAIGRFSAGLSHEISQPLTALHSYISNTQQLISLGRYADAEEKLYNIEHLADRIALIIRQLKIFVRGDELITSPVSVRIAVAEAHTIMQDRIDKADASVEIRFPKGDVHINGDDILLQQLFVNLIANALDATADIETPTVLIGVDAQDEQVTLEVSDNGTGVSESDLPNIFDPFFSTKTMGRGLGLGLTIAQEIVSRFGGEMSASNNASGGARFRVLIPEYRRTTP